MKLVFTIEVNLKDDGASVNSALEVLDGLKGRAEKYSRDSYMNVESVTGKVAVEMP